MILETSQKTFEVLRIIATWPGWTIQAISEEAGMPAGSLKNHLETLESLKMIEGHSNGSKDKRYFVSEGLALLYQYALRQFSQEAREAVEKINRVTALIEINRKEEEK